MERLRKLVVCIHADPYLRDLIGYVLVKSNFDYLAAQDVFDGMQACIERRPDAVVIGPTPSLRHVYRCIDVLRHDTDPTIATIPTVVAIQSDDDPGWIQGLRTLNCHLIDLPVAPEHILQALHDAIA